MLVTSLMRNHEDNPRCSQSYPLEFAVLRSRRAGVVVSFHCITKYIKVAFFQGASLKPKPPVESKQKTYVTCISLSTIRLMSSKSPTGCVKPLSYPGKRASEHLSCNTERRSASLYRSTIPASHSAGLDNYGNIWMNPFRLRSAMSARPPHPSIKLLKGKRKSCRLRHPLLLSSRNMNSLVR